MFLNVGLCIYVTDIVSMGPSFIKPGDGSSHTSTVFHCAVFRPFVDEVIEGVVQSQDETGIQGEGGGGSLCGHHSFGGDEGGGRGG